MAASSDSVVEFSESYQVDCNDSFCLHFGMTTTYERTRALLETKQFLYELQDPKLMPRVPAAVWKLAGKLLQHYPSYADIELVHKKLPLIFGPSPPFAGAYVRTVETEMGQEPDAQREKPALTKNQRKWLTLCVAHDLSEILRHEWQQGDAFEALVASLGRALARGGWLT